MNNSFVMAQLSDCHLFEDINALFYGVNVYDNLLNVLRDIQSNKAIDVIVFTGDLSQDHSEASYQNFVKAVRESNISKAFYFIAGNHDDPELLNHYLSKPLFYNTEKFNVKSWDFHLLNSQSETPAGYLPPEKIEGIVGNTHPTHHQFIFMHHNPVDVGYFIDKHALVNQDEFWLSARKLINLKGIGCGHIHRDLVIMPNEKATTHKKNHVPLYACPATSIQFDPFAEGVSALNEKPGYRLFTFFDSGEITTETKRV